MIFGCLADWLAGGMVGWLISDWLDASLIDWWLVGVDRSVLVGRRFWLLYVWLVSCLVVERLLG